MPILAGCAYFWVSTPLDSEWNAWNFTSVMVVRDWVVIGLLIAVVSSALTLIAMARWGRRFAPAPPRVTAIVLVAAGIASCGDSLDNGWRVVASARDRNAAVYAIVTRHFHFVQQAPTLLVRQVSAGPFATEFETIPRDGLTDRDVLFFQDLTQYGHFWWPFKADLACAGDGALVASIDGVEMLRYRPPRR